MALFICPYCGNKFEGVIQEVKSGNKKSCGCLHKKQCKINGKKTIRDLTGQRFGRLVVKEDSGLRRGSNIMWKCVCDCGKETCVDGPSLLRGYTTSCGCFQKEDVAKRLTNNLEGQQFGFLLVLNKSQKRTNHGNVIWHCKCLNCGKECEYSGNALLRERGAISCGCLRHKSKGELRIKNYLEKKSFLFEEQKTFNDCVNPKTNALLKFDFYLPNYNYCIEYDGEQHFKIIDHFGGKEEFIERQYRDNLKNQYCKDNNIKLIRIPYWDYNNIEKILDKNIE